MNEKAPIAPLMAGFFGPLRSKRPADKGLRPTSPIDAVDRFDVMELADGGAADAGRSEVRAVVDLHVDA